MNVGNVRQDLITLIPSSIISDITCFVFYDNHPRGNKDNDVLICTQRKEVIEYYKREQISSLLLNTSKNLREVRSFRNVTCDLFYFVATDDELFIISRKDELKLEHKVTDVDSYEVYDSLCSGQASLKVIRKDDAMPLFFDDNLESLRERCTNLEILQSDDLTPVIMHIRRKLTEAKYSIQCNENKYKELVNLRQVATFYLYQKMAPNIDESLCNGNSKEMASSINLKIWNLLVKLCNKKIIIAFNLMNENDVALEEVYGLLNTDKKGSIICVTKIFEQTHTNWLEREDQNINPNTQVSMVTSISLKELQGNVACGFEYDMVLTFKKSGKEYLLPFEKVVISVSDIMGKDYDVLANCHKDEQHTFLAILSTCEKTELCLRHIKNDGESSITASDIFCKHLNMEELLTIKNVVIHKTLPYHTLHGVMIIYQNDKFNDDGQLTVQIYSRHPSQVLALIHYINDAVPFRIIATTSNYKITAKTQQLAHYNEEVPLRCDQSINYVEYGSSVLNQASMLLKYLDNCMEKMKESKNRALLSKVGSEIDIFACGLEKFIEFRRNLLDEVYAGIEKCLRSKKSTMLKKEYAKMIINDE